ncbi:PspC domain-containing protein [Nonomuraea sp. MG754425]|uniref:PspC domain-containing protein n=1 Tax=Nonomuraea sp. MG754425 TaxID=2570319 RepID=UPI001F2D0A6E|nr:PspC domain-containing protein [Nonomuraea sp. MG754425]MCF6468898.1 PspC domain-containing protein [Nonomuraea sp. MG754425]
MSEYNVKKLRRTHKGRIIAGVCSGVGEFVGIDANLVRIGLAIATLFGGAGVALYAIGWLLMPDEEHGTSIVQDIVKKQQNKATSTDWSGEQKPRS